MTATPSGNPQPDVVAPKRALVSVFDKTGIEEFAKALHERGVAIISTGSTAGRIADAGVPVTKVSDVTGFPECLEGRVKTLHPMVHAGILSDRSKPEHDEQLVELGVEKIDLVIVNLYPFAETVASGASDDQVVEMIDIGGPTMVRAAAKNHGGVGIVVDPSDYQTILDDIDANGGTTLATRTRLASKAFQHTAEYDANVASWFQREQEWAEFLPMVVKKKQALRYGENPHQSAAFYGHGTDVGIAAAEQLHGKELSYNNFLDTNAAWGMAIDFDDPCVAIIKHTNPAGLATAATLAEAYPKSLAGDPTSAFGGIVATNRTVDKATADQIVEVFTEVVIAPGYDDDALEVLRTKKNLRILAMPDATRPSAGWDVRSIMGGVLVQHSDLGDEPFEDWKVVTDKQPTDQQMDDLRFAWVAAKHVKSNAIVLVKDRAIVGCGAGQMSRIDSTKIAADKSNGRVKGSVLASDAFFPFRDGPDAAIDFGVEAIVQPGGSVRDQEVIDAANERGIVMVMTGRRHFRH